MSNQEAFFSIFTGNPQASYRYDPTREGQKYYTVDRGLTLADVEKHLRGEDHSVLSIPILPSSLSHFACGDCDRHHAADAAIDFVAVAHKITELGLPLIVTRSKSPKGCHVWLFFKEANGFDAGEARQLIERYMALLGIGGEIEIFPKQEKLKQDLSTGEWQKGSGINLPFFGNSRIAFGKDGEELDLEGFISLVRERESFGAVLALRDLADSPSGRRDPSTESKDRPLPVDVIRDIHRKNINALHASNELGHWNDTLNRTAFWAGRAFAGGCLEDTEQDTKKLIRRAASAITGWNERQMEATLASGWESGIKQPLKTTKYSTVYKDRRIPFLTEKAETFFQSFQEKFSETMSEQMLWYELLDQNLNCCKPPIPRGELRHLSVDVFERWSGETVRTYPGMFDDLDQNFTDTGYGKHFIRDHGRFVRYNAETTEWLVYSDGVWRVTHDDVAVGRYFKEQWVEQEQSVEAALARLAPEVQEIHMGQRAAERDGKEYEPSMLEQSILDLHAQELRKLKYALKGQQSRSINSALELARTEDGIQVSNSDLDADPLIFNCFNQAVDLRTGDSVSHRIDLLCTKQSMIAAMEGNTCPEFEKILARSLPDQPTREYLQDFFGLCLSGMMVPDILIFLGEGANGKSLLRNILAGVYGKYCAKAAMSSFIVSKNVTPGAARSDLAGFRGVRLVTAAEANRKVTLDMETLKDWSGGEDVSARDLWQKGKDGQFKPQAKILLLMNHPPRIHDQTEGSWRRLKYVHFAVMIPRSEWNEKLGQDVLETEGGGVLNWMLAGWERVRARLDQGQPGLITPEKITADTAEYKEAESVVSRFFEDELVAKAGWKTESSEVFIKYVDWCRRNNEYTESATELSLSLTRYCADHGIALKSSVKHRGQRCYEGLELKHPFPC